MLEKLRVIKNLSNYLNIDYLFEKLEENRDYYILEQGEEIACCVDLLKLYRKMPVKELVKFLKGDKYENLKLLDYLYHKVIHITPTTFVLFTNVEINNWFIKDSIVKNMIDTFPEYNFVFQKVDEFDIDKINDQNQYFFNSTAYDCEEYRYYDHIMQDKKYPMFYTIVRYPKLLEVFDDNRKETVPFLLPLNSPFLEDLGEYTKVELIGMKPSSDLTYFVRSLGGKCEAAMVYDVNFDQFFRMEVTFNLFTCFEGNRIIKIDDKDYQCLYFYSPYDDMDLNKYPNTKEENHDDVVLEDYMASDIYTVIPITYDNIKILRKHQSIENNFMVNNILTGLGFQENFEFGNQTRIVRKFHSRVKFFDLGTEYILTSDENHYNYYIKNPVQLDGHKAVPVRLICLIDEDTHTGVLMLVNLAVKDKPGNYLDEISRNHLMIEPRGKVKEKYAYLLEEIEDVQLISFYKYIKDAYNIKMVGSPRSLIISSYLENTDDPVLKEQYDHIKSGFLYGVSIYTDAEELGKIIDPELLEYLEKPYGDAIYDYSSIYYSEIVALLFNETYKDYIVERIDFAVVDLMYLVLIQFEDAAIQNASTAISSFINYYQVKGTKNLKNIINFADNTLDSIDRIYEEYSLTLDFWDAKSNYYSSNKILKIMRERFKIEDDIARLERNTTAMKDIYTARQTRSGRFTAILLSIVGSVLTLQSLGGLFGDIQSSEAKLLPIEDFIFSNVTVILMIRLFLGGAILWFGIKAILNSISNHRKK